MCPRSTRPGRPLDGKGRFQNTIRNQLRNQVRQAHDQPDRTIAGPALENIFEFASQREDLVSIAVDELTDLGQNQLPALASEEFLAEILLQRSQLTANGGLCQTKFFTGAGNTPLLCHCPEVREMVIVQPLYQRLVYIQIIDIRLLQHWLGRCRSLRSKTSSTLRGFTWLFRNKRSRDLH